MNPLEELKRMIDGTIEAYPDRKERWKAMRAIQWRLRSQDGRYVQAITSALSRAKLGPIESAVVFDGRDNEEMKLAWFQARLGITLTVEILPQITCVS